MDQVKGTDYLSTLSVYFDCGGDLTTAAKKLFLHRNTLKYRLGRIRELTGLNLEDSVERLVAQLQVRALASAKPIPLPTAALDAASAEGYGDARPGQQSKGRNSVKIANAHS